jgi:hypothetical protein
VKKANGLEQIGKNLKHKTTCTKCIKRILIMGSEKRYPMRPLIVEIQGTQGATCEKIEIHLNKSEKVINSKERG